MVRFQNVIMGMLALSSERHCIYVSNAPDPVCVDGPAAAAAIQDIQNLTFNPPTTVMRYPHWVQYIRTLLEAAIRPADDLSFRFYRLYHARPGPGRCRPAICHDPGGSTGGLNMSRTGRWWQSNHPQAKSWQWSVHLISTMMPMPGKSTWQSVQRASLVRPSNPLLTWLLLKKVGPPPRSSGMCLRNSRPPAYPMTRTHPTCRTTSTINSMARSPSGRRWQTLTMSRRSRRCNLSAFTMTRSTPQKDGLIGMAERMGITSLTRADYGLSLTLGGGEVSLLEMTGGYAVIANSGLRVPPVAISKIVDFQGNVVYQYQIPAGEQVISPEHAFLMSSILSDNSARAPVFGPNSIVNLPFQVAVKTGTSNDSRDNWTLGYHPGPGCGRLGWKC